MEAAADADDEIYGALKALAHPKRMRMLHILTEPLSLEQIANDLKVARQTAQEHLDQLLALRLVEARRGKGDHGPITQYVVAIMRLFDIYDRLGVRLGLLSAGIDDDVHSLAPTQTLSPRAEHRPPAGSPRAVIVHGMRVGQTIALSGGGPWLVGRDPAATLCLDYDPYVSHRHAEIRRTTGGFEVGDALSSNGVWVDAVRVPRAGARAIQNGSLLRIGKTLVLFRTD